MKEQTRQDCSAESAYKAMGSLFFSSVRIKFSNRYNAMYGKKDLFRHLVAMRGKHGYAEGSSNAECIDKNSLSLPSGRWTRSRVEAVPEGRMLASCGRMIKRSVRRLRRHGLFRKPVDIAIDFHDICRYDVNPDMKYMRYSKYKNGTKQFNTLASVHCVTEGSRACLGVLMRTRDVFPIDAVGALLDMCNTSGIRIRTLLLDRKFYSTGMMNLLNKRGIIWCMPAVKTDTVKRAISEFENDKRDSVSVHSVRSGKTSADFTLIIRSAKDEDDAKKTATGSGLQMPWGQLQHLRRRRCQKDRNR